MSDTLVVRVRVLEEWDEIVLKVEPSTRIGDLKRMALDAAKVVQPESSYLMKFRGAELPDESRTVADERIPPDAGLIVLRRRRSPVR
jgi:hypothetical protein